MGRHKRRERSEFLAGYFDEFEAEISKNCAVEFNKGLNYVDYAEAWYCPDCGKYLCEFV